MDASWLVRRVTVAEAEAAHTARRVSGRPAPVPFGGLSAQWRELVAEMRPGDELWEYDSPAAEWDRNMGSSGYILIRPGAEGHIRLPDGGVVACVTCRMN
ncbi:hypothetical protein GobsT_64010 [Gemmata obscuriglobus]|uniref:Uncharacterized protein n=1 Tax=Gemmata obscuriglobus TaxID=114 RepID=A0A2Z3GTL0_9BACT|nr:hypothetical protein [Gemmata obscuriglobus]AWM35871.1 hypothetical protein C1280_01790 [Gemmata obscuriglobus]QEG31579.1 hypothetical protein GobsT_64010 [Gemmata obscuriglobus]VTS10921.1 unnamed protein product [Gemmata obscuriglobus UQM 2246]